MDIKLRYAIWFLLFSFLKNQYSFADITITPSPPKVPASSYLLMDHNSGKILIEENIHQMLPPASLTKMMTVYVVANELKKLSLIHI